MYGILTWSDRMPDGFPLSAAQNSGNMVHSKAPVEMFPNTVTSDYGYRQDGFDTFADFVNERCSALIIPMANTLHADPAKDAKGASMAESLSKYKVPIVAFGLGAQARTTDLDEFDLGPGMIELVRFLSDRAAAVSVRGDFTYRVFEKYGSTERVFNTGCPSFYSHPEAFQLLKTRLETGDATYQRTAFAGTHFHLRGPRRQLHRAIDQDLYLIEPVNGHLHQFYLDCINDVEPLEPAYFLRSMLERESWDIQRLKDYMIRRYRLFRDMHSWLEFNRESIDGTLGSRFHVNMASLLSGLPAVWVVHDSRTQELCDRLSLPHISEYDLKDQSYRDVVAAADYGPLFDSLAGNFAHFNEFLRTAGLPEIRVPSVV